MRLTGTSDNTTIYPWGLIQRERTTNEVSIAGKDVHCEESLFPLKFLNIDYQICIQCSRRTGKKNRISQEEYQRVANGFSSAFRRRIVIGRIDVNLFKAGSKCVLNTRSKCVQKYNFSKNFANGYMYLLSLMAPRLNFSISSVNFNDLPSRFPFTGRANVGVFTLLFCRG